MGNLTDTTLNHWITDIDDSSVQYVVKELLDRIDNLTKRIHVLENEAKDRLEDKGIQELENDPRSGDFD